MKWEVVKIKMRAEKMMTVGMTERNVEIELDNKTREKGKRRIVFSQLNVSK